MDNPIFTQFFQSLGYNEEAGAASISANVRSDVLVANNGNWTNVTFSCLYSDVALFEMSICNDDGSFTTPDEDIYIRWNEWNNVTSQFETPTTPYTEVASLGKWYVGAGKPLTVDLPFLIQCGSAYRKLVVYCTPDTNDYVSVNMEASAQ